MTRWPAVSAALVAIGAIVLVLWWGVNGRAGTPPFEMAVLVLSFATPIASILLAWQLWRAGRRGGALLTSSPLLLMLIGTAFARAGNAPSLKALLWLDLYVLCALLIGLRLLVLKRHVKAAARSSHDVVR